LAFALTFAVAFAFAFAFAFNPRYYTTSVKKINFRTLKNDCGAVEGLIILVMKFIFSVSWVQSGDFWSFWSVKRTYLNLLHLYLQFLSFKTSLNQMPGLTAW